MFSFCVRLCYTEQKKDIVYLYMCIVFKWFSIYILSLWLVTYTINHKFNVLLLLFGAKWKKHTQFAREQGSGRVVVPYLVLFSFFLYPSISGLKYLKYSFQFINSWVCSRIVPLKQHQLNANFILYLYPLFFNDFCLSPKFAEFVSMATQIVFSPPQCRVMFLLYFVYTHIYLLVLQELSRFALSQMYLDSTILCSSKYAKLIFNFASFVRFCYVSL